MDSQFTRVEFDELGQELHDLLEPRYKRLGYLGEFFRASAHQPDALAAFIRFTESAKSELPKQLVEIIALTASTVTDNAYERNQHERLSVRLGYGRDWVKAVQELRPDDHADLLGTEGAMIQRYVIAVFANDPLPPLANELAALLGEKAAVAVIMVTARYVAHAKMIESFAIGPVVPSIWEDDFDGK